MKKSRRLKLKAQHSFANSTTTPVAQLFLRMATGYKRKLATRVKNWFIRTIPEKNYPSVPWGGAQEQSRRRRQILGLAGAQLTDANGIDGNWHDVYTLAYATEFPHLVGREVA